MTITDQVCTELMAYAEGAAATLGNGVIGPTALSRMELRQRILDLEAQAFASEASGDLQTCDMDETFPLRHIFAPGAYAREMSLPARHWAIGKIHKHAHLSFITKGRIAVLTEDGPVVYQAPFTFVSTPLTKRVVFALEDTIWTTVHLTAETDLAKIEQEVIAKDFAEVDALEAHNEFKGELL